VLWSGDLDEHAATRYALSGNPRPPVCLCCKSRVVKYEHGRGILQMYLAAIWACSTAASDAHSTGKCIKVKLVGKSIVPSQVLDLFLYPNPV